MSAPVPVVFLCEHSFFLMPNSPSSPPHPSAPFAPAQDLTDNGCIVLDICVAPANTGTVTFYVQNIVGAVDEEDMDDG